MPTMDGAWQAKALGIKPTLSIQGRIENSDNLNRGLVAHEEDYVALMWNTE